MALDFGKCYKYLDMIANGFWSPKKILTYGKPTCLVTGTRSVGKSTGVAGLCLINYVVNHKKFIYVRRRPDDVVKTYKTFFNNAIEIINRYTDIEIVAFKADRGSYWIAFDTDPDTKEPLYEECGRYIPLSKEENYKSNVFSEYTIIVYDEFISKDPNKYLGTRDNVDFEWDSLVSLYQTVDRGILQPFRNETVLFLLGNKSTIYNPVCLTIGLVDYVHSGAHFTSPKNKPWVWEDVDRVEAVTTFDDSFAYQMSSDSVKRYAYENLGADNDLFIKKPEIANYVGTFKLRGEKYGIYNDMDYNFYIAKPKEGYSVVAVDIDSHDGNDLHLIRRWIESPMMEMVSTAYKRGRLYFANGKIKAAVLKYLEFVP